eukprot:159118_1
MLLGSNKRTALFICIPLLLFTQWYIIHTYSIWSHIPETPIVILRSTLHNGSIIRFTYSTMHTDSAGAHQQDIIYNIPNATANTQATILQNSYYSCFIHAILHTRFGNPLFNKTTCALPSNYSVTITKRTGYGMTSSIWTVWIRNNTLKQPQPYVMKWLKTNTACEATRTEYKTLYRLHEYNASLPVLWLHPHLNYYSGMDSALHGGCMFFIQKVHNSIKLCEIITLVKGNHAERAKKHIAHMGYSPLEWILRCYNRVLSVLEALVALNIFYNDLHSANILISKDDYQCYLIDFGYIIDLNDDNTADIYCVYTRCPASTYYKLRTFTQRQQLGDNRTVGEYAVFHQKYQLASIMLHLFIHICGKMQKGLIMNKLLQIEDYFDEFDYNWERNSPAYVNETMFQIGWHKLRQIVGIFGDDESSKRLLCFVQNTYSVQMEFLRILSVYEHDIPYLNGHK